MKYAMSERACLKITVSEPGCLPALLFPFLFLFSCIALCQVDLAASDREVDRLEDTVAELREQLFQHSRGGRGGVGVDGDGDGDGDDGSDVSVSSLDTRQELDSCQVIFYTLLKIFYGLTILMLGEVSGKESRRLGGGSYRVATALERSGELFHDGT